MRHQIWKKGTALTAAFALAVMPGLVGCGAEQKNKSADSGQSGEQNKEKKNTAMGRYLEEDVTLPEGCGDIADMTMLEDGSLRVCYFRSGEGSFYADSSDGGKTWGEAKNLTELLGIDSAKYTVSYPKLSADGGIFLTIYPFSENVEEMSYYYISPDGTNQKMDIGNELSSGYITDARFTDHNTVIINDFATALLEISLEDGSIVRKYEEGGTVSCFAVLGNHLIAVTDTTLHYYNLETGEPLEDEAALTEQITSDEMNLQMTSTSSFPLVFTKGDEKDSIFYTDDKGIYRYSFGGSVVEQVIDGKLNRISSPDISLISMVRDKDGNFYLAVQDSAADMGNSGKILKYAYSPDTPATPDTELTVYSLTDNTYIRQVAALFQKKYPDIYLNLEIGITDEDAMTGTDALKNLNTEIMAGNGPDVLVMDGIPSDTYVEKGMLKDISGILDKIEKEDGILENIRESYVQEDGSQYVMPVRFGIPMIQGQKEDVTSITDLTSMADTLEKYQGEYSEKYISISLLAGGADPFIRLLADVNAPAWLKEDGTLDEAAVTEYLEQANRIYQTGKAGIDALKAQGFAIHSMSEIKMMSDMSASAISVLGGYYKLSAGLLSSPDGLSYLYSAEQKDPNLAHILWNGQAQNCFIPKQTVGISAKAAEPEAAEKLVEFLFSKEGQETGTSEGFPVNETVYDSGEYWAVGDENGKLGTLGSGNAETGEYIEFDIVRADEENTKYIQELGKTLTQPSEQNEIILEAVASNGSRYLEGEISLEEAAKGAIQQANLYLSE
ncbi:ABC transporter substrate-binding protein [Blautia sp. XA-2221]|uniref:ABC transporter substrate-binding protein n=1 Tax=Blautia sp. XA-2221 TaxID=2903961 RepID=UPI002379B2F7|nr:ABC transporter substrate-binding protein [Blautia sp. XA-2221]